MDVSCQKNIVFLHLKPRVLTDATFCHRINFGRPRIIPKQKDGIKVHRSVKIRLDAGNALVDGKKYVPRAKWHVDPEWVD